MKWCKVWKIEYILHVCYQIILRLAPLLGTPTLRISGRQIDLGVPIKFSIFCLKNSTKNSSLRFPINWICFRLLLYGCFYFQPTLVGEELYPQLFFC